MHPTTKLNWSIAAIEQGAKNIVSAIELYKFSKSDSLEAFIQENIVLIQDHFQRLPIIKEEIKKDLEA